MRSLRREQDFKKVFDNGKRFTCRSLTLLIIPGQQGFSRFGIICSKKLSKKSVERNRIRRRIREALRILKIQSSWDAIIIPRTIWLTGEYKVLADELKGCLERAGIV